MMRVIIEDDEHFDGDGTLLTFALVFSIVYLSQLAQGANLQKLQRCMLCQLRDRMLHLGSF